MPHPSRSISGRGWPDSVLMPPMKPLSGIRPPFNQYETGAGDASTWHSSATSDPNGAPNNCDGALTVGETIKKELGSINTFSSLLDYFMSFFTFFLL